MFNWKKPDKIVLDTSTEVEENVVVAEKTEEKLVTETIKSQCNLISIDVGYNIFKWSVSNFNSKSSMAKPWLDFYKWYFGTDKPYYVFKSMNNQRLILRKDIRTFNVEVIDV